MSGATTPLRNAYLQTVLDAKGYRIINLDTTNLTIGVGGPFADNIPLLKNNLDPGKQLTVLLDDLAPDTPRTWHAPNLDGTVVLNPGIGIDLNMNSYNGIYLLGLPFGNTLTLAADLTVRAPLVTPQYTTTLNASATTTVELPPTGTLATVEGTEPALGNPPFDGYVLSSTAAGVRSWVADVGGGGAPFTDSQFLVKGSVDTSKQLRFELDTALGPGVQLVLTPPSVSGTLATLLGNEALRNKSVNGLTPRVGTSPDADSVPTFNDLPASTFNFEYVKVAHTNPNLTLRTTGATDVVLPTTGTLATTQTIIPLSYLDVNPGLKPGVDNKVSSQKAVKTFVETRVGSQSPPADGTPVPSAPTISLVGSPATAVQITGTTTIQDIDMTVGQEMTLLFTTALTVVHNPTILILPGGRDILTAPGDYGLFRGNSITQTECIRFQRGSTSIAEIRGGSVREITNFSLRFLGGSFDLRLQNLDASMTANHQLGINVENGDRLLTMGANITVEGGDFSSFGGAITLQTASASNVVVPASGTLYSTGTTDVAIADGGTGQSTAYAAWNALHLQGADIPASATLNLDTATGHVVDVTGSAVTITSITLSQGKERTVRFTGANTIANGVSLILPAGADITTAAGDYATFVGYAGAVRLKHYLKFNGTALIGGGGGGSVTSMSSGTLAPLFTTSVANPTTTPAISYSLTNAAANTFFGNNTGAPAAPIYMTAAQARTSLGLVIGTDVQAFDPDLTTWAGVTPAAGIATFLATPTSANLATAMTNETGSGSLVFATSPTLVTPVLGVATATSINKVTITTPATGSTLNIADGKTLKCDNSITLAGTDASTLNIGAGGTLGTNAFTSTAYAPIASPVFTGTVSLRELSYPSADLGPPSNVTATGGYLVLRNDPFLSPLDFSGAGNQNIRGVNVFLYGGGGTAAGDILTAGAFQTQLTSSMTGGSGPTGSGADTLVVFNDTLAGTFTKLRVSVFRIQCDGHATYGYGHYTELYTVGASGQIDNATAYWADVNCSGAGTLGNITLYDARIDKAGGTVTGTVKGLNLSDWTINGAAHAYGIYIDASVAKGAVGDNYAIQSLTTAPSSLAGQLRLRASTVDPDTAPIRFTNSGALQTTPQTGSFEFKDDAFYGTITTGNARKQFAFTDSPISQSQLNTTVSLPDSSPFSVPGTPTRLEFGSILTANRTYQIPSPTLYPQGAELTIHDPIGALTGGFATFIISGVGTFSSGDASIRINENYTTVRLISDGTAHWSMRTMLQNRILARRSATLSGAANGVEEICTLSQVLDFIGSPVRGDILYRGASAWAKLPAGTAGQVLTTQGTSADPNWTTPGGGGNVTGSSLTSNAVVLGNAGTAIKVVTGITTDGTSKLNLGESGTSVGAVVFSNITGGGGTITLQPTTGALGTVTLSLPATTDTLVGRTTVDSLTNKTLVGPTLIIPQLGIPASGTLTNCTGLPIATGVAGLGTGVATFLATPSSANLAAALTDETGTGANVFASGPTLINPVLGIATASQLSYTTTDHPSNATQDLDWRIRSHTVTLGTNTTITFSNVPTGYATLAVRFTQDATGGRTITWPGVVQSGPQPNPTALSVTHVTLTTTDGGVSAVYAFADYLGALTVTSINKVTISQPATSATLTIANLKTLTCSNTLTFAGTDGSTLNIGAGGTLGTSAFITLGANVGTFLATPSSANLASAVTDETGSGALVFATSPTLVTPVLGTPASGDLSNCTGYDVFDLANTTVEMQGFLAAGTSAALRDAVVDETGTGQLVFANTPTLTTPVLGTPTSGTLTNCTGLPISTGVSGLGTGVATFLATPSSANLATAVTDETGSGALVFATSPTLVTPALGTPSSGTLTSCTGLPISSGVSGLGSNVATFLATPSSANLAAALTDETGSGANVFATSPTIVTPTIAKISNLTTNGVVNVSGGDGTLGSAAGLPYNSMGAVSATGTSVMPIVVYAKSVSVLTAGAPADLTTITLPTGITRWMAGPTAATAIIGRMYTESGGTHAAASFAAFDATGGGGVQMFATTVGPGTTGTMVSWASANALTAVSTTGTLTIRQTVNSGNAGTITFYIPIYPLP